MPANPFGGWFPPARGGVPGESIPPAPASGSANSSSLGAEMPGNAARGVVATPNRGSTSGNTTSNTPTGLPRPNTSTPSSLIGGPRTVRNDYGDSDEEPMAGPTMAQAQPPPTPPATTPGQTTSGGKRRGNSEAPSTGTWKRRRMQE